MLTKDMLKEILTAFWQDFKVRNLNTEDPRWNLNFSFPAVIQNLSIGNTMQWDSQGYPIFQKNWIEILSSLIFNEAERIIQADFRELCEIFKADEIDYNKGQFYNNKLQYQWNMNQYAFITPVFFARAREALVLRLCLGGNNATSLLASEILIDSKKQLKTFPVRIGLLALILDCADTWKKLSLDRDSISTEDLKCALSIGSVLAKKVYMERLVNEQQYTARLLWLYTNKPPEVSQGNLRSETDFRIQKIIEFQKTTTNKNYTLFKQTLAIRIFMNDCPICILPLTSLHKEKNPIILIDPKTSLIPADFANHILLTPTKNGNTGTVYDAESIKQWLRTNRSDPFSHQPLGIRELLKINTKTVDFKLLNQCINSERLKLLPSLVELDRKWFTPTGLEKLTKLSPEYLDAPYLGELNNQEPDQFKPENFGHPEPTYTGSKRKI